MYAIVESGGKQYKMAVGETCRLEKIKGNIGDTVEIKTVLLIQGDQGLQVGQPYLNKAMVTGEILKHSRGEKVTVFKKKRRKGYEKKQGHRQSETWIRVQEIRTAS